MERRRFVDVAMYFEGSILLVAVLLAWVLGIELRSLGEISWPAVRWSVFLTLPLLAVMWVVSELPWAPFERIRREMDALIGQLFADASGLDIAMIALLAGVGEETLFRGVIQSVLGGWLTPWWGLAIASVLFGLMHFVTPTYALLATVIGAYLGSLFLLTGNLIVPILVHTLYDVVALAYLVHARRATHERSVADLD